MNKIYALILCLILALSAIGCSFVRLDDKAAQYNAENFVSEELDIYLCDDVYITDDTPTHGSGSISLPLKSTEYEMVECKLLLCDDGCDGADVANRAAQGYALAYSMVKADEFTSKYITRRFAMQIPEHMEDELRSHGEYDRIAAALERDYYYLITLDDTHYAYIRIKPSEGTDAHEDEASIVDEIIRAAIIK